MFNKNEYLRMKQRAFERKKKWYKLKSQFSDEDSLNVIEMMLGKEDVLMNRSYLKWVCVRLYEYIWIRLVPKIVSDFFFYCSMRRAGIEPEEIKAMDKELDTIFSRMN